MVEHFNWHQFQNKIPQPFASHAVTIEFCRRKLGEIPSHNQLFKLAIGLLECLVQKCAFGNSECFNKSEMTFALTLHQICMHCIHGIKLHQFLHQLLQSALIPTLDVTFCISLHINITNSFDTEDNAKVIKNCINLCTLLMQQFSNFHWIAINSVQNWI